MRVTTHDNAEARRYAARLLSAARDPLSETRNFYRWLDRRLKWEDDHLLDSLSTGVPVRGFVPYGQPETLDTWAN